MHESETYIHTVVYEIEVDVVMDDRDWKTLQEIAREIEGDLQQALELSALKGLAAYRENRWRSL